VFSLFFSASATRPLEEKKRKAREVANAGALVKGSERRVLGHIWRDARVYPSYRLQHRHTPGAEQRATHLTGLKSGGKGIHLCFRLPRALENKSQEGKEGGLRVGGGGGLEKKKRGRITGDFQNRATSGRFSSKSFHLPFITENNTCRRDEEPVLVLKRKRGKVSRPQEGPSIGDTHLQQRRGPDRRLGCQAQA